MPDGFVLLPVMIPFGGAVISLLLYRWSRPQALVAGTTMVLSTASAVYMAVIVWMDGMPAVFQVGLWPAPFGITLLGDILSATMVGMVHVIFLAGTLYAIGCRDRCVRYPGFYTLFLMLATALSGAFLAGDVFNLFVFSELIVICSALLTAISDDKMGIEAAFKYFYINVFASAFILLAIGALYVSFGTLNMADLAQRIQRTPNVPLMPLAVGGLLAYFMVKSAGVPFHFWLPDFHMTAPTPVSAMLSSVVVKLGVYGFLRMVYVLFVPFAAEIRVLLVIAGLLGVFVGGFSAVATHNAKRMLAYSTIGQLGFIFVAIGWGTPAGLAAAIVFIINHSLLKSAMLLLAGALASRAPVKSASFDALMGVGKASALAGVLFAVGGMGLAGVPPTNGFISKMLVFRSGLDLGQGAVVALLGVGSAISLVYVFRAFQHIWWCPLPEGVKLKARGDSLVAPFILLSLSLILGIWAEPVIQLAQDVGVWTLSSGAYIWAVLGR